MFSGQRTIALKIREVQPGVRCNCIARASRCSAVARLTTFVRAVPAFKRAPWNQSRECSRCEGERMCPSFCRSSQTISVGRCWRRRRPRIRWPVPKASIVTPLRSTIELPRQTSPRPTASGKSRGEAAVVEQFGLDVFQMGAGLVFRVGDDPDVVFLAFDGRAERQGEGADGRFRAAARAEHVEFRASRAPERRRTARPSSGACSTAGVGSGRADTCGPRRAGRAPPLATAGSASAAPSRAMADARVVVRRDSAIMAHQSSSLTGPDGSHVDVNARSSAASSSRIVWPKQRASDSNALTIFLR